jgi:protein SCO1/2
MVGRWAVAGTMLAALAAACVRQGPREYELRGVVVAVDPTRQEITIKHDDIPRFMPGMTMPFKVRDSRLLEGRVPGDLVRAMLVVDGSETHLRTLERTGSGPVPDVPAPPQAGIADVGELVFESAFTDQDGARRRLSEWRGRALGVTFIYTRCPLPNFCPLMDQRFKAVQDMIRADASLRERIHLLSVTFDPEFDRPPVLAAHARQLGADSSVWSFLTGEREAVERFTSQFGVSIVRDAAGGNEIVHNLRTAVIGPDGRLSAILNGNEWTPQQLVAELRKALGRTPAG